MAIYFYGTREKPYGCFSNFSKHGFELDELWWPTTEHYFQAQKFVNTDRPWYDKIREAKTPKEAAKMGRDRTHPLRSDWEQVKDGIMQQGVLKKFETHADIREILLGTGDEKLVENSPTDYYWGCGKYGSGKNKLGQILMTVREILRDRQYFPVSNEGTLNFELINILACPNFQEPTYFSTRGTVTLLKKRWACENGECEEPDRLA